MVVGRVVLLNGVSSSGKSSISDELQGMLSSPFLAGSIDTFVPLIPEWLIAIDPPPGDPAEQGMCVETHDGPSGPHLVLRPGPVFHRFVRGMHHAVAAMARQGNDIIFDDVIYDPAYFRSYLDAFEGIDVWFVGVKLPLHVAEERERQRGDRAIGHARGHFDLVHCHGPYDIEVDAEAHTARECAEQIVAAMKRRREPDAFTAARAQL
jgi:chloramphenicol 3-O phosphotransferase